MRRLSVRVPPKAQTNLKRGRNFDLLSIGFAIRLHLRPAEPYVDQRSVGNLRLSACRILTDIVATYANILTSQHSIRPYDLTSMH